DLVLLGTGFESRMPRLVRWAASACGVEEIAVSRAYRMVTPPAVLADCYLQGTNEETHGIADSLISVLAVRAGEIVEDILSRRANEAVLAGATASRNGAAAADPAVSSASQADVTLPGTTAAPATATA